MRIVEATEKGSGVVLSSVRSFRDFPGGPMAKTPCSQCRGPGFSPWLGNQIPQAATKTSHAANEDPVGGN